jgi:hypothetical protein
MAVSFDLSGVPESVYKVVKDVVGSAIGVSAQVGQPAAQAFPGAEKETVEANLLEYAKKSIGDEAGEVTVQVEDQPATTKTFTLTRHARTVGVKFDCLVYTFTVQAVRGTMQVFVDKEPVSPVGHWLGGVNINGSVTSKRVSAKITHSLASDDAQEEKGAKFLNIDVEELKGRGWFNWDGDNSRDTISILADGTISISSGKHLEEG